MWLNTRSMLAALVALAAIPSSLATPYSGSSYCKHKCSSKQIDAAFKIPAYLDGTKAFCRQFLHLPATSIVTKTRTVAIPVYYTRSTVKTKTAIPVTVTRTKTGSTTVVNQETSLTTNTDISTISSTSTILVVSTSDVTKTDYVIATSNVVETVTITTTATSTATDEVLITVTTYTSSIGGQKMKRLDSMNENKIQIFRRGSQAAYSYAFKIPSYLPQDLNPQQIAQACKRLSLCSTRTTTITKKVKVPYTKIVTNYSTVTPSVSTTLTIIQTIPKTNTVQQTIVTTIFYTTITSVTVIAQTITETIATETQTTATITTTVGTDTITQTASETVSQTLTRTVTQTASCSTGIAVCSLNHPESCCSGHCVQFFNSPNCCVDSGQPCDIIHPEGCCSGGCRYDHQVNGAVFYVCI